MKFPIADALNLKLSGVTPKEHLIAMIIIAMELCHRQRELGFAGAGVWRYRIETPESTGIKWHDYVTTNAGFDDTTYRNYRKAFCVVRDRLRADDMVEAIELMEAKPSTLTPEQRQDLIKHIGRALREGDKLASLRREYRQQHRTQARAEAGTGALTVRMNSGPFQNGGPFGQTFQLTGSDIEEMFAKDNPHAGLPDSSMVPSGGFWLLVAAATCRYYEGARLSATEIEALGKCWFMGYRLREGKLVGPAAEIAAMAEERGASPAEGVAIAQMILLDEGRGFPIPPTPPKPSEQDAN